MDSLTHLVLGHAMGAFARGATPAIQTGAYWGALVGNSLPDIDVPVGYLLGKGWGLHRKFTHTIPGVLLLSLAAASVITLTVPGSSFLLTLAWTLAGCVVHVFLDCLNLFGTRPFWPFSTQFLGVGVLFIMDPIILSGLSLASLLNGAHWLSEGGLRAVYLLMWGYIAFRWVSKAILDRKVQGPGTRQALVTPWLASWRYFRETSTGLEYGKVGVFSGELAPLAQVEPAKGPAVEASKSVPAVAAFIERARFPFAEVRGHHGHTHVTWQDLFSRLRGGKSGVEVVLDENLRPL